MLRNIEVQNNYDQMVGIRVIKSITILIDNLSVIPQIEESNDSI